ncbi:hypothetical protein HZB02_00230 [Candidatus Woesearchaeota archaeon]|nr:hypothetical protein [Candidatus Woesearchaeota archaeon]
MDLSILAEQAELFRTLLASRNPKCRGEYLEQILATIPNAEELKTIIEQYDASKYGDLSHEQYIRQMIPFVFPGHATFEELYDTLAIPPSQQIAWDGDRFLHHPFTLAKYLSHAQALTQLADQGLLHSDGIPYPADGIPQPSLDGLLMNAGLLISGRVPKEVVDASTKYGELSDPSSKSKELALLLFHHAARLKGIDHLSFDTLLPLLEAVPWEAWDLDPSYQSSFNVQTRYWCHYSKDIGGGSYGEGKDTSSQLSLFGQVSHFWVELKAQEQAFGHFPAQLQERNHLDFSSPQILKKPFLPLKTLLGKEYLYVLGTEKMQGRDLTEFTLLSCHLESGKMESRNIPLKNGWLPFALLYQDELHLVEKETVRVFNPLLQEQGDSFSGKQLDELLRLHGKNKGMHRLCGVSADGDRVALVYYNDKSLEYHLILRNSSVVFEHQAQSFTTTTNAMIRNSANIYGGCATIGVGSAFPIPPSVALTDAGVVLSEGKRIVVFDNSLREQAPFGKTDFPFLDDINPILDVYGGGNYFACYLPLVKKIPTGMKFGDHEITKSVASEPFLFVFAHQKGAVKLVSVFSTQDAMGYAAGVAINNNLLVCSTKGAEVYYRYRYSIEASGMFELTEADFRKPCYILSEPNLSLIPFTKKKDALPGRELLSLMG